MQATTMIKNEADAAMALQVSNTLTQALLTYRLNMLSDSKTKVRVTNQIRG